MTELMDAQIMFIVIRQSHKNVLEGAKQALESHGAGMSSVRFICGTQVRDR